MMSFFTRPRPHHGGSHTRTNSRNKTLEEIRGQVEAWGLEDETIDRIFTETSHSGNFNVGRYTKHMEDMMRVKNSLGLCAIFSYQGLILGTDLAMLYNASTGEDLTPGEMIRRGERVSNLAKLVNVREGFSRKDDKVPEIWFNPMDSPEGTIETRDYFNAKMIEKEDAERMLDDYYDERGWDIDKGTPTQEKLEELGLEQYSN
jgi:aldehyde:ferredoxin oxidoreductase